VREGVREGEGAAAQRGVFVRHWRGRARGQRGAGSRQCQQPWASKSARERIRTHPCVADHGRHHHLVDLLPLLELADAAELAQDARLLVRLHAAAVAGVAGGRRRVWRQAAGGRRQTARQWRARGQCRSSAHCAAVRAQPS
jgi:hypothetical protein